MYMLHQHIISNLRQDSMLAQDAKDELSQLFDETVGITGGVLMFQCSL